MKIREREKYNKESCGKKECENIRFSRVGLKFSTIAYTYCSQFENATVRGPLRGRPAQVGVGAARDFFWHVGLIQRPSHICLLECVKEWQKMVYAGEKGKPFYVT